MTKPPLPMLVLAVLAAATPGTTTPAASPAPPVVVRPAAGPIHLDGDLSDPGWQGAAVIDQFWEARPGDNVPPKVKTTAWVTYDERHLYVALRCEDKEPSKIRAPFVERDAVVGTDDNVAVFLDTRGDRLTALELRVSPRGQQGDAVFNDASQTEDFAPDFFYDTAARITDFGWAAEMRIPFSSLRYPKRDEQSWGILIWRNYPREYRYAIHSRPVPRGSDCIVCHAQPLVGLVGLPSSGGLVLAPYASGQDVASAPSPGEPLGRPEREGDVGLDVKWQPASGQALDATLNPDFSQVESDVAQIAVNNRFALFYPEKRPFFMEGVDLFDTPVQAVYTRTITSPRWGGRATGRTGASSYAVLAADDRGGGSVVLPGPTGSGLAAQDFGSLVGIGRLRHDFTGGSYLGALFAGRESDGDAYNRVVGPDLLWRLSPADRVSAQVLWSETRTPDREDLADEWDGRRLTGHGLEAFWNHQERHPSLFVRYRDFSDGFRADTGFVPQVGYRQGRVSGGWTFYPEGLVASVRPQFELTYAVDREGRLLARDYSAGFFLDGRRNLTAFGNLDFKTERTGDKLLPTTQADVYVQVDPSRKLTRVGFEVLFGEAIDLANQQVGTGADVSVFATLRPFSRLTLELTGARRWLDVPANKLRAEPDSLGRSERAVGGVRRSIPQTRIGGNERLFTATVARLRAVLHFSPRAYLRLIGQWVGDESDPALYPFPVDAKTGRLEGSALFTYKINWQTALYLGYGDERALDESDDLRRASRQLFAKISYAFQR